MVDRHTVVAQPHRRLVQHRTMVARLKRQGVATRRQRPHHLCHQGVVQAHARRCSQAIYLRGSTPSPPREITSRWPRVCQRVSVHQSHSLFKNRERKSLPLHTAWGRVYVDVGARLDARRSRRHVEIPRVYQPSTWCSRFLAEQKLGHGRVVCTSAQRHRTRLGARCVSAHERARGKANGDASPLPVQLVVSCTEVIATWLVLTHHHDAIAPGTRRLVSARGRVDVVVAHRRQRLPKVSVAFDFASRLFRLTKHGHGR